MMDRLREGVNSLAIKVILGVIILSFALAGVSSYLVSGHNNAAADVDGVKISRSEFEHAYQNERSRMQSQLGDYFSKLLADPAYVASLRHSVLDRMVNDVLIEQHAKSLGLRVSDEQVSQEILNIPQFKNKGKFDQTSYKNALARAGFTPDSFASYIRGNLLREQLISALQSSEFSLKKEARQQATLFAQKRTIRTVSLNVNDIAKKMVLNDSDISKYYDEHKDSFMRPEQLKVSYIELSAKKLKGTISVSNQDIQDYYQQHLDQYSTKEQRHVSHILIKGNNKASAEAILKQIQNGADFSTVAKEKSQDVGSASHGGDLGWIEKGVMDPAFEKAVFNLASVGDITGLVKSSFGYHIIKLDGIKSAKAKPLSVVKSDIVNSIRQEKAVDKFYKLQNDLEKVAFESPDSLEPSAEAVKIKVQNLGYISLNQLPKMLAVPSVKDALTHEEVKEEGLNSSVIEISPEDVVVVRVDDVRPEAVLLLDKVKKEVKQKLTLEKANKQAKELADHIIVALEKGDKSVMTTHSLYFGEKMIIDRNSPLSNAVFEMKKPENNNNVYRQTQDVHGNVIIVELDKVESNPQDQFVRQVGSQLDRLNRQLDVAGILNVLRHNTNIKYYIETK